MKSLWLGMSHCCAMVCDLAFAMGEKDWCIRRLRIHSASNEEQGLRFKKAKLKNTDSSLPISAPIDYKTSVTSHHLHKSNG